MKRALLLWAVLVVATIVFLSLDGCATVKQVPIRCTHMALICATEAGTWENITETRIVGQPGHAQAQARINGVWHWLIFEAHPGGIFVTRGNPVGTNLDPPWDAIWEGPDVLERFINEQFGGKT